ncbi:unnamed protein product [Protopolystoma xenopodis]|uniref:Protein kinase SIK1/2/3 UBA domain-containing protein n=1 Tax=Protopolystoma xenopodis TaxID=117903 RepID=A0A448WPU2_9PLAT|nr:unnamed protein product [Protopolystoma xenopodis]
MSDKWINFGFEPDPLVPYVEPGRSQLDEVRVTAMMAMGFRREELESSVVLPEFDHIYATYNLLPAAPSEFAE